MNLFKDSQTNWKYILIVVILALFVGGGILWCTTRQEFLTIQWFIEKEDEAAVWKTYRNEEFGFELEYPKNYFIQYSSPKWVTFAHEKWKEEIAHNPTIFVVYAPNANPGKTSLRAWLSQEHQKRKAKYFEERPLFFDIEDSQVNTILALKYRDETAASSYSIIHIIAKGPDIVYLGKNVTALLTDEEHLEESYNLVLSTFKFLE